MTVAADAIYVPIIYRCLSMRTFEQTSDFFKENNLKPKRLHAFYHEKSPSQSAPGEAAPFP